MHQYSEDLQDLSVHGTVHCQAPDSKRKEKQIQTLIFYKCCKTTWYATLHCGIIVGAVANIEKTHKLLSQLDSVYNI